MKKTKNKRLIKLVKLWENVNIFPRLEMRIKTNNRRTTNDYKRCSIYN